MIKRILLSAVLAGTIAAAADMHASSSPPPLMAHGVVQCGEIVALWVLKTDDDHMVRAYRTDAMNHPDAAEYEAFLRWVDRTPKENLDMYEIPCSTEKPVQDWGRSHKLKQPS